jgi:hypothetical protein
MTPAEIDALVARTVALSQSWRRAANALLDEAHARLAKGTLTADGFQRVFADYLKIVQKAIDLGNAATDQLAEGVGAALDAMEKDTARLTAQLAALAAVRNLIAISLKLLVAIGAVALAVVAPSPASAVAAVAALGDAVDTIVSARSSE